MASPRFGEWTDADVEGRMGEILEDMEKEGLADIFIKGHPWHQPGYESSVTIGKDAPDSTVYSLEGEANSLLATVGAAPTVLNLGSYT